MGCDHVLAQDILSTEVKGFSNPTPSSPLATVTSKPPALAVGLSVSSLSYYSPSLLLPLAATRLRVVCFGHWLATVPRLAENPSVPLVPDARTPLSRRWSAALCLALWADLCRVHGSIQCFHRRVRYLIHRIVSFCASSTSFVQEVKY
jgi:hypothetical protein